SGSGGAADPGWKPVAWAPRGVDVATNPKAAALPISWASCAGSASGCEKVQVSDTLMGAPPYQIELGSVLRTPKGYRVALTITFGTFKTIDESRSVVYDESGSPLVAWRMPSKNDGTYCTPIPTLLRDGNIWFGVQFTDNQGGGPSGYIFGTSDTI